MSHEQQNAQSQSQLPMDQLAPMEVDSLIHADWIAPAVPADQLLENHCIAIKEQKILDILPSQHVDQRYFSHKAPATLGRSGPSLPTTSLCSCHAVKRRRITLLKQSVASVIHCPESNLKLASGFCPVAKLQHAGINVALGTDGAASNNNLDMFSEMRAAALLAKAVAKDAEALPAAQALQMATINGAKALGIDQKICNLECGKFADIVAVDFNTLNCSPVYNPLSQLVYSAHSQQVSHVSGAGRLLLKEHKLVHLDALSIREKAAQWRDKIRPTLPR